MFRAKFLIFHTYMCKYDSVRAYFGKPERTFVFGHNRGHIARFDLDGVKRGDVQSVPPSQWSRAEGERHCKEVADEGWVGAEDLCDVRVEREGEDVVDDLD